MKDKTPPAPAPWASYTVPATVDAKRLELNANISRKATKVVTGKLQQGLNLTIAGLSKGEGRRW